MNKPYIRVFDNKGKTWDRYTIVIYDGDNTIDEQYASVFGMSENANSPSGFNQYSGSVAELPAVLDSLTGNYTRSVGREIELLDAPLEVRLAIGKRLKSD